MDGWVHHVRRNEGIRNRHTRHRHGNFRGKGTRLCRVASNSSRNASDNYDLEIPPLMKHMGWHCIERQFASG